nr:unnamed protein product [Spirometra erinaceieuropaei]
MELRMNLLANLRLTVNTDKTVAVHQLSPNAAYSASRIHVNSTKLKTANNFAFSGSALLRCIKVDYELAHRIFKTSQAFGRLQSAAWNRHGLHLNTKIKMHSRSHLGRYSIDLAANCQVPLNPALLAYFSAITH